MKAIKLIVNGLILVVGIVVTIILLSLAFGFKPVVYSSYDMLPLVKGTDACFVKLSSEYKIGDVIAYGDDGTPKLKRVVGVDKEGYLLVKADRVSHLEKYSVDPDRVIGKLFFSIPYLGYVFSYISDMGNIILSILFVLLLFGISSVLDRIPIKNKNVKKSSLK